MPSHSRCAPISDQVDTVPVIVRAPRQTVSFITPTMVDKRQVSRPEVETAAPRNLAAALTAAKLGYGDVDGVRLGFLGTELPIKAALILAPNLREPTSGPYRPSRQNCRQRVCYGALSDHD
jgi:hypothetical protein